MTNIPFYRGAIDSTGCISNAWNMLKLNYWLYFAISLIVMGAIYCIPCLNIFLLGPLTGGIYYAALKDMRGEPIEFSMMFKGFEKFGPLLAVGVVQAVPGIISQILQITFRISGAVFDGINKSNGSYSYQQSDPSVWLAGGFLTFIIIAMVAFMLFSLVWSISFAFAVPIVIENNVGVMDALKLSVRAGWSNFGGIIVLSILLVLISIVGVLALCVGILFVIPIIYVAWAFAYRQVFPTPDASQFHNAPPSPDHYASSFGQGL